MQEFITNSQEETMELGRRIASNSNKGDVYILSGELGAGKTKFVEGFLSFFGLENEISSPTFTIVNEYNKNSINIYHFDVYRLSDIDEFYAIGGDEYFSKGICLIEWGDIIKEALPKKYKKILIQKDFGDFNKRVIKIKDCIND